MYAARFIRCKLKELVCEVTIILLKLLAHYNLSVKFMVNTWVIYVLFQLSDERKKMVGGKIEVKLRVRNPILSKEIRQLNEKWLVIDGY